jgi:hypothetical protein
MPLLRRRDEGGDCGQPAMSSCEGIAGVMPMAPGAWPQTAAPCGMRRLDGTLQKELESGKIKPGRIASAMRRKIPKRYGGDSR